MRGQKEGDFLNVGFLLEEEDLFSPPIIAIYVTNYPTI